MSKCYILDEHNKSLKLSHNETLDMMTMILKNGKIVNGIILHDDKAYEYIELDSNGEKIRILKNVTFYYNKINENEKLFEVIGELKKENRSLKKDNLTKLYRADYAMKIVRRYILLASKNNIHFSVVMADIDKFKSINDTYGHEFGNRVLQKIGATILDNVKSSRENEITNDQSMVGSFLTSQDIIIRYGGEEILILYKNISLEQTIKLVENLRKEISLIEVDGVGVTMSFGIYNLNAAEKFSELNENNIYKNTSKIVEYADKALYHSKENGRNATSYYDDTTKLCDKVTSYTKK